MYGMKNKINELKEMSKDKMLEELKNLSVSDLKSIITSIKFSFKWDDTLTYGTDEFTKLDILSHYSKAELSNR